MLGNRKLVLDNFCEVYDLLKPWAHGDFWNFADHEIIPGSVYLIGRAQMNLNRERVRQLVENDTIRVILSNPAEGSATLKDHCNLVFNCGDLVQQGRLLLIGGGDMEPGWPCLPYDIFLTKILDYEENLAAQARTKEIYSQHNKPYKFLFLNGRNRAHRKYLIEKFRLQGLLDQSLWTNLENRIGTQQKLALWHNGIDLMQTPTAVQLLPPQYEVSRYSSRLDQPSDTGFVKYQLFNNEWGDIYIEPSAYIDTYFSVVTETVFDYPYSFRTEKIWKPIAMGHPWIAVANTGYYKDMHNLGFRTFGHIIDESFDSIQDDRQRIDRVATVVEDLCRQDLAKFLEECYTVCKYNQQHLAELRVRLRQEFPDRFFQFIKENHFDE